MRLGELRRRAAINRDDPHYLLFQGCEHNSGQNHRRTEQQCNAALLPGQEPTSEQSQGQRKYVEIVGLLGNELKG